MKKLLVAFTAIALAAALGASVAPAKDGKGGGKSGDRSFSTSQGSERGLDRADIAGGKHGAKGRGNARTRGSHSMGFCPPGQAKKSGNGSRFAC